MAISIAMREYPVAPPPDHVTMTGASAPKTTASTWPDTVDVASSLLRSTELLVISVDSANCITPSPVCDTDSAMSSNVATATTCAGDERSDCIEKMKTIEIG